MEFVSPDDKWNISQTLNQLTPTADESKKEHFPLHDTFCLQILAGALKPLTGECFFCQAQF